jgi:hypothetical protein
MTLIQALQRSRIVTLVKEDRVYHATNTTIYLRINGTENEIRLDNCNDWPALDNGWRPLAYDIELEKIIVKK